MIAVTSLFLTAIVTKKNEKKKENPPLHPSNVHPKAVYSAQCEQSDLKVIKLSSNFAFNCYDDNLCLYKCFTM